MSTSLGLFGTPTTSIDLVEAFKGDICFSGCIYTPGEGSTLQFCSPVFSGTYIHSYRACTRKGYWGWD